MPKIQINLPKETNEKLKELAKKDLRSLTNYITLTLVRIAEMPDGINTLTSSSITEINGHKIKNITFAHEKSEQILSPEEEELKQQKLNLQKDKILKEREKKWFERAKEYMKKYWNDDRCQNFAKDHIYGNIIWQSWPDDPVAIAPEPDDSRLEELLSQYRDEAIDDIKIEEERQEREEAWKKIDSMVDNNTGEPDNEYYKKIKAYYSRCEETSALKELLTRLYLEGRVTDEILNYVKDYHMMNIFYALDIPVTHDLTDDEWRELLSNLIISK